MTTLTHDEMIETGCALLECAFAAREAAKSALAESRTHRERGDTDRADAAEAKARRHRERASLLLASLSKIRQRHEAEPATRATLRSVS